MVTRCLVIFRMKYDEVINQQFTHFSFKKIKRGLQRGLASFAGILKGEALKLEPKVGKEFQRFGVVWRWGG